MNKVARENQELTTVEFTNAEGDKTPIKDSLNNPITKQEIHDWAQVCHRTGRQAEVGYDWTDQEPGADYYTVWIDEERRCTFTDSEAADEIAKRINELAKQVKSFDTHFTFTVWIHIHGRDEEGAIDNTRDYFSEDFVSGISNQMTSLMDYEPEVVSELQNGLFEVALNWSGYWSFVTGTNAEEAKKVAEQELDTKLEEVHQTLEKFASEHPSFTLNGNMADSVEDVIETAV